MLHIDYKSTRRFGRFVHCAGCALVIAALAAIYAMLYAPTMKAAEEARLEIGDLKTTLEGAPRTRREHAQVREKLRDVEDRLANIRRRVPKQASESEFLATLDGIANEVGLTVTNLSPGPPQGMGGYSQMDISVTGVGGFESVCRFVDRVRGLPRLAKVVGLDVRTDKSGQGVYPVKITVAIFYDLVVQPDRQE